MTGVLHVHYFCTLLKQIFNISNPAEKRESIPCILARVNYTLRWDWDLHHIKEIHLNIQ
jgi:hypothetical protein